MFFKTNFTENGSNVLSMARMTHMILPGMIQRGRGVVLNIGSISGAFASNVNEIELRILT